MKKINLIFLMALLLIQCSSVNGIKGGNVRASMDQDNRVDTGWSNYSEGLYYRNLAAESKNIEERNRYADL